MSDALEEAGLERGRQGHVFMDEVDESDSLFFESEEAFADLGEGLFDF